jgi:hypothetical protein
MVKFAHPENTSSAREFMNWHHFVDVIRRELASGVSGVRLRATTSARLER